MLSVAIIARDEERHIGAALDSLAGMTDQVLVLLDSRTADRTAAIAHDRGARVIVEPWRGFSAQRNRALELCAGEWVLFLDADERVSPELGAEIQDVLACSDKETRPALSGSEGRQGDKEIAYESVSLSPVGYWIPRHNQFFGKTLRGGGWYPDHQLRLLRRERARYDEALLVHEFAQLDGPAGYLSQHLLHLNIERVDELWRKQTSYAMEEAQTLYRAGRRARWRNFVGAPLREFWRRYLTLGGYRDGAVGLLLCATLAYFEWVKFAHLKGLEHIAFERSNV
ncbi:MAG TPA: glycosyltransferase family 2 protein [Roseiflexaceae bacterium]|nr:glycosyltransferase family 2 protein [Roseiflexaceae bacterium]